MIRWDEEWQQIVLVDEFETTTHVLNANGEWEELKEYKLYGTRSERLVQTLDHMINEVRMVDGQPHANYLGLDEEKIQQIITMIENGESVAAINEVATKTEAGVEIFADAEGQPTFVVVVGGEYGLDQDSLVAARQAAARLEEIDPGISRFLVEQFGAKVMTGSTSFAAIREGEMKLSSNEAHYIIINNLTGLNKPTPTIQMFIGLVEAGEIFAGGHIYFSQATNEWQMGGRVADYQNFGTFACVFR